MPKVKKNHSSKIDKFYAFLNPQKRLARKS